MTPRLFQAGGMDGWSHGELGKASWHLEPQMQHIHTVPAYMSASVVERCAILLRPPQINVLARRWMCPHKVYVCEHMRIMPGAWGM